jgi:hypothetical protein
VGDLRFWFQMFSSKKVTFELKTFLKS